MVSDVQTRRSNLYYFVGKIEPWNQTDDLTGVSSIETLTTVNDNAIRANNLFVKQVKPSDVSLVVKRYDWLSGKRWSMWNDADDMTVDGQYNDFYCLAKTSDPQNERRFVYKCLDNGFGNINKNSATFSTLNPADHIGTRSGSVRLADGYTWKFMYEIPEFKYSNFASANYIPVQRSLQDSFYSNGGIEGVSVVESGTGYSGEDLTTITIVGTTTGTGGDLRIAALTSTGGIESSGINIFSSGSGYTHGAAVRVKKRYTQAGELIVTGVGFSGYIDQDLTIVGVITPSSIVVTSTGYGYTVSDELEVVVGDAFVKPILNSNGSIMNCKIIRPGYGYTAITSFRADSYDVSGSPIGSGMYGNITAVLNPVLYRGSIVSVSIIDPGKDYGLSLDTAVIVTGTGKNAVITPVVDGGAVIDAYISNPGSGYTNATAKVVGSGTGAVLDVILSSSDFRSEQSVVEQTAIDGGIHAIGVTNSGFNTGYTVGDTSLTVVGDGSGCVVEPVIVGGSIVSVRVLTPGSGYTASDGVSVVVTTSNRAAPGLIDAVFDVVFAPIGGHGRDAVSELYGKTICINSYLKSDPIINSIQQEFRQFGLLRDPREAGTNKQFRVDAELVAYTVSIDNAADLQSDEQLVNSNGSLYRVVYRKDSTVVLQPNSVTNDAPTGQLYVRGQQSRVYDVSNIISSPTLNKYSGGLLYVSNEKPFVFNAEQSVAIKTFIEF